MNEGMDFSEALLELKAGKKVSRKGWNGKGMFVYFVRGSIIGKDSLRNECEKHVSPLVPDGTTVEICPHIDMKAADGSVVIGWLASQTDMLAEDWGVVL